MPDPDSPLIDAAGEKPDTASSPAADAAVEGGGVSPRAGDPGGANPVSAKGPGTESDVIAGLFSGEAPPSSPPPAMTSKPKIDFAALRRARSANVGEANTKVSKIFGGGEAVEPGASEPASEKDRDAEERGSLFGDRPAPAPPPPAKPNAIVDWALRASTRVGGKIEEAADQIRAVDPALLKWIGVLGAMLCANAVVVFVFAALGWI